MSITGETLFSEEAILSKVRELGERISSDYAGNDILLVGILKGALLFTADLARSISRPLTLDFLEASSYGNARSSSGNIVIRKDLDTDIAGKHVLLIDTIIDSGRTLDFIVRQLAARRPESLRTVTLLDKQTRRIIDITPAYTGFTIPDLFVVGYGMDYAGKYRHLPSIVILSAAPSQ